MLTRSNKVESAVRSLRDKRRKGRKKGNSRRLQLAAAASLMLIVYVLLHVDSLNVAVTLKALLIVIKSYKSPNMVIKLSSHSEKGLELKEDKAAPGLHQPTLAGQGENNIIPLFMALLLICECKTTFAFILVP